jgi:CBS domain-containing protein
MRVTDLIKGPAITVVPRTTLAKAAKLLDDAGVGALLVVDAGQLTGIVTDRDIVVRGVAEGLSGEARVDSVMTTQPVTIDSNADIAEASQALAERKFRRLPVVNAGSVVGIITADDLLLAIVTQLSDVVWPIFGEVLDPQHTVPLPVRVEPAH